MADTPAEPWNEIPVHSHHTFIRRSGSSRSAIHRLATCGRSFPGFASSALNPRNLAVFRPKRTSPGAVLYRAVRELRINPEGRGHHILNYVSANDPSPAVRRRRRRYVELRHAQRWASFPRVSHSQRIF